VEWDLGGEWKPRKDRPLWFWKRNVKGTDSSVEEGLEVDLSADAALNGVTGNRHFRRSQASVCFSRFST
jgi:hypothetical protein